MKSKNPGGKWHAEVKNFGWRKQSGYSDFTATDGSTFLGKILPNTDCDFTIYEYGTDGIALNNMHHDSPTGDEWYYIVPAKDEVEESKVRLKTDVIIKPVAWTGRRSAKSPVVVKGSIGKTFKQHKSIDELGLTAVEFETNHGTKAKFRVDTKDLEVVESKINEALKDPEQYGHVFFRIEAGYKWGSGMDPKNTQAFFAEITQILTGIGFKVTPVKDPGGCPTADRGIEHLYCHPMDVSGWVKISSIPEITKAMTGAKTFTMRSVDTVEEAYNYTPEEFQAKLVEMKPEFEAELLSMLKTPRKNLYKRLSGSFVMEKARRLVEKAKGMHSSGMSSMPDGLDVYAQKMVRDTIDELVKAGKIVKAGEDMYRTASPKDPKPVNAPVKESKLNEEYIQVKRLKEDADQDEPEPGTKVGVKSVWLNRGEGPSAEVGKPVTVGSYEEANKILHRWAQSAPKEGGGYDKVDFKVTFTDGEEYEGRCCKTR
jgi:hypothetical protein